MNIYIIFNDLKVIIGDFSSFSEALINSSGSFLTTGFELFFNKKNRAY